MEHMPLMFNLAPEHQTVLLATARQAIQFGLSNQHEMPIELDQFDKSLREKRACFVTLNLDDNLRGCIGTLSPYRPLVSDLSHNAYAAAFHDPRFPALVAHEFPSMTIRVSILSDATPITFTSEPHLLEQLQAGVDGLILEDVGHRATFLPSVWDMLPDPKTFLLHLKQKAGLPENYWSDSIKILRYHTHSFSE